ncbi:MAG: hypothetical protein BGO12_02275 [Verrucomicrobia bacterium 61-8]|nr:MAG: hypothetical protein BGO12_02275 [Verrucomicrobia bacterium 61-8]
MSGYRLFLVQRIKIIIKTRRSLCNSLNYISFQEYSRTIVAVYNDRKQRFYRRLFFYSERYELLIIPDEISKTLFLIEISVEPRFDFYAISFMNKKTFRNFSPNTP